MLSMDIILQKKKKKVILFNGYQRHNMTFMNKAVVNF